MSEPPRLPVEPGEILAGKYRVDRVLGSGAMGVVVAATHVHLDDVVAIKFMVQGSLPSAQAIERFAREARAAVKIKSEHVVRVHDVGTLESGAPYMVMEYLEGKDLAAWLSERGTVPIEQAVDFLLQAAEAIAEAHSLGIVHRDLKPANLFVLQRAEGGHTIKVLDFGISKLTKQTGSDMTQTSVVMGSPFYMSPEQLRSSRDVDHRSDIWALGVILYELIAGGPPFEGDTMPELVHRTVSEPPLPLLDVRPDAPPELEDVILTCLEKDPNARYQSVAQLAAALVRFGPDRAKLSLERISGFSQLTAKTMPSQPALAPSAPPRASRRSSSPSRSSSPAQSAPRTQPSDAADRARRAQAETAVAVSNDFSARRRKTLLGVASGAALLAVALWFVLRSPAESAPRTEAAPPPSETFTKTAPEVPNPPPSAEVVVAPTVTAVVPPPSTSSEKTEEAPVGTKRQKRPAPVASAAPSTTPPAAVPSAAPSAPKKPSFSDLIDDRK